MESFATLFHMLPQDVIINHIAPYTYLSKPENLMLDVRTFISDYQLIEDYYLTMLNARILLHDLLLYYKKKFGANRIRHIYKQNFHRNPDVDTKNRILLAKMSPTDRCLFITPTEKKNGTKFTKKNKFIFSFQWCKSTPKSIRIFHNYNLLRL